MTNASGVEERLSEQPIGTSDEDALLAGIAGGLVGRPDGLTAFVVDLYSATRQVNHRLAEPQRLHGPDGGMGGTTREQLDVDY